MSSKQARVQDDDDDLDDLDDIVDQFESTPLHSSSSKSPAHKAATTATPPPSSSKSAKSPPPSSSIPDGMPEDIAKQFAANMEAFMRDLNNGLDGEEQEEFKKNKDLFEKILMEGMNGLDLNGLSVDDEEEDVILPPPGNAGKARANGVQSTPSFSSSKTAVVGDNPSKQAGATSQGGDDFQKNIRQTMEKLRESDSTLKSDASSASTDPLEKLWGDLAGHLDGDPEDDEQLQGILENMMQQLMSKEVLHEPLKELKEKFPSYLAENRATLPAADVQRFEAQLSYVNRILAIFDDPSYTEDNTEKNVQIVTLMNEMQSHGSPPADLMGPLPPGFDMGPDGMPKIPDGCIIS